MDALREKALEHELAQFFQGIPYDDAAKEKFGATDPIEQARGIIQQSRFGAGIKLLRELADDSWLKGHDPEEIQGNVEAQVKIAYMLAARRMLEVLRERYH